MKPKGPFETMLTFLENKLKHPVDLFTSKAVYHLLTLTSQFLQGVQAADVTAAHGLSVRST